jgi:hypothetical protein
VPYKRVGNPPRATAAASIRVVGNVVSQESVVVSPIFAAIVHRIGLLDSPGRREAALRHRENLRGCPSRNFYDFLKRRQRRQPHYFDQVLVFRV